MSLPSILVALALPQVGPLPKVGEAVPLFSIPDQDGRLVSSDSLRGRKVVLAFYPKDFTPG